MQCEKENKRLHLLTPYMQQRMRGKAHMRKIREGDILLTPTQANLLGFVAAQTTISGVAQATKKELSQLMGCSVKTIGRAITRMSPEGLIKVEPYHSENRGQLPNVYSVVKAYRGSYNPVLS